MFWKNKMSISREEILGLLKDVSDQSIKKFRQELMAQNEEVVENALRKYKSKVARRSWSKAQQWCKWSDESGPILMPDKVRMYYRRGNTEVVLQEISPQVRHLKFTGSLALRDNSGESLSPEDATRVCSYSLALPYIHFIYRFRDGMMDKAMVSFSDRPLKNLQEKPYRPYFSNINNELRICHGAAFKHDKLIKSNITQQISYCLDLFWQTVFKDEWSQFFWQYKTHFAQNDQRMATFANWQEASIDNPLFVLENVPWMEHSEKNYGTMLVRLFDLEPDSVDTSFQQDLFNDLVDNFLNELSTDLTSTLKEFQTELKLDCVEEIADQLMKRIGAV